MASAGAGSAAHVPICDQFITRNFTRLPENGVGVMEAVVEGFSVFRTDGDANIRRLTLSSFGSARPNLTIPARLELNFT